MGRLANLKRDRIIRAFARAGWKAEEGRRHTNLTKEGNPYILSVPRHRKVKEKLLTHLIKLAGLTVDEFLELYH